MNIRLGQFVVTRSLLLALFGFAATAQATFVGDEISVTNIFRGDVVDGPTVVTVADPGVELFDFGFLWTLDVGPASIGLTCGSFLCSGGSPGAPDEYLFEDFDWIGSPRSIVGAILDSSGAVGDYGTVSVSFTRDSVRFSINGNLSNAAYQPVLGDTFLIGLDVNSVPEAATLSLFALNVVAMFGVSRARRLHL